MRVTVSPLFGAAGDALHALRVSNPEKNLSERWRLMVGARPDFAIAYGFVSKIIEGKWAVVAVPDDAVAYTVGLHYRFGHKELLISAPHLPLKVQKRLLNEFAAAVAEGARFEPGQTVIRPEGEFTFSAYGDETFERYPCGYLARFEQLFEDRAHVSGGTLPVLWAELVRPARASAPRKLPRPTKVAPSVARRSRGGAVSGTHAAANTPRRRGSA